MIDGASAIDPLVAEGPLVPVENLRPAVNMQRVLLLDGPAPMMADLASGDIRPWENGPPVSVPMVSTEFDVADIAWLQVQILRDPRPSSTDNTLLSVALTGATIDIVETTGRQLEILHEGQVLAVGPIGGSPAVVVVLEPDATRAAIHVSARNAETMSAVDSDVPYGEGDTATITVGGPSTAITGAHGRRRLIPVHLEMRRDRAPTDQVRRAVSRARRVAGALKNRAL